MQPGVLVRQAARHGRAAAPSAQWYSHGHGEGGDALDLIQFVQGPDPAAGISWLRERGYIPEQQQAPRHRVVCTYPYCDEHGTVRCNVDRLDPANASAGHSCPLRGWPGIGTSAQPACLKYSNYAEGDSPTGVQTLCSPRQTTPTQILMAESMLRSCRIEISRRSR
jgi:hypothetical protein